VGCGTSGTTATSSTVDHPTPVDHASVHATRSPSPSNRRSTGTPTAPRRTAPVHTAPVDTAPGRTVPAASPVATATQPATPPTRHHAAAGTALAALAAEAVKGRAPMTGYDRDL